MSDLVIGLHLAGARLAVLGVWLVARFAALNLWAGLLLGGAVVLDLALARRVRAAWRVALYAPVALRVLLPLGWTLRLAHAPRVVSFLAAAPDAIRATASSGAGTAPRWQAAVAAIYVVVAFGLGARWALAAWRLRRRLATARPLEGAHDLEVPASGALLEHRDLGPMALGLLRPRVIVPQRLLAPGRRAILACVLRHEAAHLRRRDPWLAASLQILLAAAWPVLPLWIAAARVRQLVELACDEAATEGADSADRRRYGHALLDVARWESFALAPVGAELRFGSTLRARIEALTSRRHWPRAAQAAALFVLPAALFAACGGSTALPESAAGAPSSDRRYDFAPDTQTAAASAESAQPEGEHSLEPDLIQNVVRANFGRFRTCYETALARNPKLEGRVNVRFVIALDGSTTEAADQDSTLPDKEVVACVVDGFRKLTYPEPHGGVVSVVYPIEFSP